VDVLVPGLVAELGSHGVQVFDAFGEAAREDLLGSVRHHKRFCDHLWPVSFDLHFEDDLLLVFVDDGDGEIKANNHEIHWRARYCQGNYPSGLTAALITNAPRVGENIEIVRVFSA
jgi:hypothetical protein